MEPLQRYRDSLCIRTLLAEGMLATVTINIDSSFFDEHGEQVWHSPPVQTSVGSFHFRQIPGGRNLDDGDFQSSIFLICLGLLLPSAVMDGRHVESRTGGGLRVHEDYERVAHTAALVKVTQKPSSRKG